MVEAQSAKQRAIDLRAPSTRLGKVSLQMADVTEGSKVNSLVNGRQHPTEVL